MPSATRSTSWGNYAASVSTYEQHWALLDEVLYELCRRFPTHEQRGHVNAKMWIIGRTYQTGLERKVEKSGSQGGALSAASEYLHRHHKRIDATIERLVDLREPLDPESLGTIIRAHGTITRLVSGITIRGQSTRSFVSKYLHFHCPIVPIYDSYAVANLRRLVRWNDALNVVPHIAEADDEYSTYVLRFFDLYSRMRAARLDPKPTVRRIDRFLVEAGDA